MRIKIKEKKGFTLIEIIFIVGISSLILLAISKTFPYSFEAKHRAENYSQIVIIAQSFMEELKRDGYNSLEKKYPPDATGYGVASGQFKSHPDFTWQVEWWQTEIPNLRKLEVKVYGKTEKEGYAHEMDLATYIAARD